MRIGLAVALVLAALPATADARTLKLHRTGTAVSAADGGRYVVTRKDPSSGPLRVRDERTGNRSTLADVPEGCVEPVVGGRWLVMGCPTADAAYRPHPRVWNLTRPDRPAVDLPPPPEYGTLPYYHFTAIDGRWVAVTITSYHAADAHGLIERSSGRFVRDTGQRPCTPRAQVVLVHGRQRLLLRRCGTRRTKVLSHCTWSDCSEPVIAGGAVAWYENERVRAVVLRTGRRRAWQLPRGADPRVVSIALSHRHVFVNGGWRGTLPGR